MMMMSSNKGKDPIEIHPELIEFENIESAKLYVFTIYVHNVSGRSDRLRFRTGNAGCFTVNYVPTDSIASGLEVRADIEFMMPAKSSLSEYRDVLTVSFGNFKKEIPLIARGPRPKFRIENNGFIDMGYIISGASKSTFFTLQNIGTASGNFKIVCDDDDGSIVISPREGTLQVPSHGQLKTNSKRIKVEFRSDEPGIFRKCFSVDVDGQSVGLLDINANVVEHTLEVVDPQTGKPPASQINLGMVYFGQQTEYQTVLVNNGPQPANFRLMYEMLSGFELYQSESKNKQSGDADDNGQNGQMTPTLCRNSPIVVSPEIGVIEPFQQVPVTFRFAPQQPVRTKGFKADSKSDLFNKIQIGLNVTIISDELDHNTQIKFSGVAIRPQAKISQSAFNFGSCPTHDRRDILCTVSNSSMDLAFDFTIQRTSLFSCKPASGKLLPGQSQNLLVTFSPNQLGDYKSVLHLVINQGIYVIPLKMKAKCNAVGESKRLVGGPNALVADFKPQIKYVDPQEVMREEKALKNVAVTNDQKEIVLTAEDHTSDTDSHETVNPHEPKYTYTKEVLVRRKEHRDQYTEYIKSSMDKRAAAEEARIRQKRQTKRAMQRSSSRQEDDDEFHDYDDDDDNGLSSPRLDAPEMSEPLWTENPLAGVNAENYVFERKPNIRIKNYDDNKLIKSKFKPAPTTLIETEDCDTALQTESLDLVTGSTTGIDFGTVSVFSRNVKCLAIANDTGKNVLVEIDVNNSSDLDASGPKSQVIPTGQIGGFDIVLYPTSAPPASQRKEFKATVTYMINKRHRRSITVSAFVVPAKLLIDKTQIHCRFAPDNLSPVTTELITLTNPSSAPVRFSWQGATAKEKSTFQIEPSEGVVEPNASTFVEVAFAPVQGKSKKETYTLRVRGGSDEAVTCTGYCDEPKCSFAAKSLNLGSIPIGTLYTATIDINNTGKSAAVFQIDQLPVGIVANPYEGLIPAGNSMPINIEVLTQEPIRTFDHISVVARCRGGGELKLQLEGNAVVPTVTILESATEFGSVMIGNNKTRTISLKNEGQVSATMVLDMSDYPEFEVTLSEKNELDDFDAQSILLPIAIGGEDQPFEAMEDECGAFNLTVPAGRIVNLDVTYSPMSDTVHNFKLPLNAPFGSFNNWNHYISGEGVSPIISLSMPIVNFDNRVIGSGKLKSIPAFKTIQMQNTSNSKVHFVFDSANLKQNGFLVKPMEGVVDASGKCDIKVGFLPEKVAQYSVRVPIFVNGNLDEEYISCTMIGNGVEPRLAFDTNEVVLPIVPLGVKARATLLVQNLGYDALELKPKLSAEAMNIPLQFSFPVGSTISLANPEIPVEITFSSPKPLSFVAKVDFVDTQGHVFSVRVTGTAENSVMTTYPFLDAALRQFEYKRAERKPVQLTVKSETGQTKRRFDHVVDSHFIEANATVSYGSYDTLLRFCNSTIFSIPIAEFPNDLVKSQGKTLCEFIESASGQKIQGRKFASNKKGKAQTEVSSRDHFMAILAFLRQRGAHLHDIRPEHFFTQHEYVRYMEKLGIDNSVFEETNSIGGGGHSVASSKYSQTLARRKQLETDFKRICMKAWVTLLIQVVKLFVLNRVTTKQLQATKGTSMTPALLRDISEGKSNVYSNPEMLLLAWLQYHYARGSEIILKQGGGGASAMDEAAVSKPEAGVIVHNSPLTNFANDFCDGVVLCTVLASHFPTFAQAGQLLGNVTLEPAKIRQVEANHQMALDTMRYIGLGYYKKASEYGVGSNSVLDNLIFTFYLFQTLPKFVPRDVVEFNCALGEHVRKMIELQNSSSRPVAYQISLDGSDAFSTPEATVVIDPESIGSVCIDFHSKLSRQVDSVLTLKPDSTVGGVGSSGEGGFGGSGPIVFRLVSAVHSRVASKTIRAQTRVYEPLPIEVHVTNPFSQDAKFKVDIQQERIPQEKDSHNRDRRESKIDPAQARRRPSHVSTNGGAEKSARRNEAIQYPAAFSSKQQIVRLRAGESIVMMVNFLPFMTGEYRCQIGFVDPSVGEFMYEVVATAELPQPVDTIKFDAEANKPVSKLLMLAPNYAMKSVALKNLPSAQSQTLASSGDAYDVLFTSPYFTGPKRITNKSPSTISEKPSSKQGSRATAASIAQMNYEFTPKNAGIYTGLIVLTSTTEVRVYQLEVNVRNAPVSAEIHFCTPVKQVVLQEIPLMNSSDAVWPIHIGFEGSNAFSGPTSLTLPPSGTNVMYPLRFSPSWVGEFSAKMTMRNTFTEETMIYTLQGVATEPLAENHIIVNCQARTKVVERIKVANTFSKELVTFEVQSDLPHVSGPSSIRVPYGQVAEYELTIAPLLGGTYSGSITFSLGENQPYVWYTMELRVSSPEPEDTLDVSTFVRSAVAVEITLQNPLATAIELDVNIQGHGLIGEGKVTLGANESAGYQLIYAPLLFGKHTGSVSFMNEDIGEIWYRLSLEAQRAPPESLPAFTCPIGAQVSQTITLENPTESMADLKVQISNRQNFSVIPANPKISPLGEATIEIRYTPSSISDPEDGVIVLTNDNLGEWEYHVEGKGTPPGLMPATYCRCVLGETETCSATFRNPFSRPLAVAVAVEGDMGPFRLLLKKPTKTVPAFGSFSIPVMFSPSMMNESNIMFTIQAINSDTVWKFPVVGHAEAPVHPEKFRLRCKAREVVSKIVELPLAGFDEKQHNSGNFSHEWDIPGDMVNMVEKSISIIPVNMKSSSNKTKTLAFNIEFSPMKSFATYLNLVITSSTGGRWRFQFHLTAEEPALDDVITIAAPINQTASVAFKLVNYLPVGAPFRASLTVDSAYQFSVYPTSGVLKPLGDEDGTSFVVSYSPTEYGKDLFGKLVIETDDMQWSYQVRGTLPEYSPPQRRR